MTNLSPAVIEALEAERDALNARFAQSVRGGVQIDRDACLRHVRDAVAPLVDQVHAVWPERARNVVTSLFEVSLDLFSAALLGPEAKSPWVERVWHEILPAATWLLAREPRQVAGCLCNAAAQIAGQQGARPHNGWSGCGTLRRRASRCRHCFKPA